MQLSQSASMRMEQRQLLTPRMIQSMEILQLPLLALEERLAAEVEGRTVRGGGGGMEGKAGAGGGGGRTPRRGRGTTPSRAPATPGAAKRRRRSARRPR